MAERTLRERCIEAGAKAMRQRILPRGMERIADPDYVEATIRDMSVALDAILGVLTEHADEYYKVPIRGGWSKMPLGRARVEYLLAVLGGDE